MFSNTRIKATKLTMEAFNFGTQNPYEVCNHAPYFHDSESSINSSSCRNFSSVDYSTAHSENSSPQRNWVLSGWPDYQLQNMCGTVDGSGSIWTDGISVDSLRKEHSPDTVYQKEPACAVPDLQWSKMSHKDPLTDLFVNSERLLNGSSRTDASKYVEESGVLSATGYASHDRDFKETKQPSCFPPNTFEGTNILQNTKASLLASSNSSLQNESVHMNKEESLEETVLQELIDAMQQMDHSTRIGFRDAFYSLARNVKQISEVPNSSQMAPLMQQFMTNYFGSGKCYPKD